MRTFFLLAALAVVLPAHSQPAVEAPDLVLPDEAANAAMPADARKDLVADFGSPCGIWMWKQSTSWQQVHGVAAEALAVADLDRNRTDNLVVDVDGM